MFQVSDLAEVEMYHLKGAYRLKLTSMEHNSIVNWHICNVMYCYKKLKQAMAISQREYR